MGIWKSFSNVGWSWNNEDGELNPGEDVTVTIFQHMDEVDRHSRDVRIGETVVAEGATAASQMSEVIVNAPQVSETRTLPVYYGDTKIGSVTIHPGTAETEGKSAAERGYTEDAETYNHDVSEPSSSQPVEEPEVDPADQPGLVHADNEQGFALAPSMEDDYSDADALIEDAQDGTLDVLDGGSDSDSSSSGNSDSSSSGGSDSSGSDNSDSSSSDTTSSNDSSTQSSSGPGSAEIQVLAVLGLIAVIPIYQYQS
ncbi:hypothetical protein ABSL23_02260 [Halobacterium sp. NMX12-1]|uniref:PGF-CTERM sorting domain-containing protein n=1 Tax=Halobacterium sp. NMX12-1 TaxID=3166650 RepID=A0AAU8CD69_9EURY